MGGDVMSFQYLMANVGAVCCVVAATVLAIKEIPGWGWFLLVGLMMTSYFSDTPSDP